MKANYFQQKAKKTDTLSMVWYILMLSHVPGSLWKVSYYGTDLIQF